MSVVAVHLSSDPKRTFGKESQPSITLLKGLGVSGDIHAGKKCQHRYLVDFDLKFKGGKVRDNLRQVHLIQSELFHEEDFHGLDGRRVEPGQLGENVTTAGIDLLALGRGARLHFVDEGSLEQIVKERGDAKRAERMRVLRARLFDVRFVAAIVLAILTVLVVRPTTVRSIVAFFLPAIVVFLRYTPTTTTTTTPSDDDGAEEEVATKAVVTLTGLRIPCKKVDTFRQGLKAKCEIRNEEGTLVGRKAGVMGIVEGGGVVRPGMKVLVEEAEVWEKMPYV